MKCWFVGLLLFLAASAMLGCNDCRIEQACAEFEEIMDARADECNVGDPLMAACNDNDADIFFEEMACMNIYNGMQAAEDDKLSARTLSRSDLSQQRTILISS